MSQIRRVWVRYPALFWSMIAQWCAIIVLATGGAVVINRANDNSHSIAQSICAQVKYLTNIAETSRNPRGAAELKKLAAEQAKLAQCPPGRLK